MIAPRFSLAIFAVVALVATTVTLADQRSAGTAGARTIPISFADARPSISANANAVPAALKGKEERDFEVRRVGIIGPGLDFSDKAEGYDFYPLQTIQPFGIIDSLLRLGLAQIDDIKTVTFDLSPRVNQHLESAGRAAWLGKPYVLQLPLDMKDPAHDWSTDLISYWRRFGDQIGATVRPLPPPSTAAGVQMRAISVRANVVASLQPRDANIVLERTDDEPFDLVVATNILVYYDAFEQSLALTNISKMLRPGGFLLTNYAGPAHPAMEPRDALRTPVFWDRQGNGDTLLWYQRR